LIVHHEIRFSDVLMTMSNKELFQILQDPIWQVFSYQVNNEMKISSHFFQNIESVVSRKSSIQHRVMSNNSGVLKTVSIWRGLCRFPIAIHRFKSGFLQLNKIIYSLL